jgi:hypothetical protein
MPRIAPRTAKLGGKSPFGKNKPGFRHSIISGLCKPVEAHREWRTQRIFVRHFLILNAAIGTTDYIEYTDFK